MQILLTIVLSLTGWLPADAVRQVGRSAALKRLQDAGVDLSFADNTNRASLAIANGTKTRDEDLDDLRWFPELQSVALVDLRITARGLGFLRSCMDLKSLSIHKCRLVRDELADHLRHCKQLTGLILLECDLSDAIMPCIGELAALESLGVHGRNFTDEGLASLRRLTRLTSVGLYRTSISGTGLRVLQGNVGMKKVALEWSPAEDVQLDFIRNFPALRSLRLTGSRVTSSDLVHLQHAQALYELLLDETQVDLLPAEFGCPSLELLDLSRTKVSDADVRGLVQCPKLVWLHLGKTRITDKGMADIVQLKELTSLFVTDCAVTDVSVPHVVALAKLERVFVGGTKLTQAGMTELKRLKPGLKIFVRGVTEFGD